MLNPFGRREGVEWIKRHASEDIGLFATAYFYIVKQILKDRDIQEILETIPADKQNLPYYQQIRDAYNQKNITQTKPNKGFTINGYVEGLTEGIAELVLAKQGTLGVPEVVDSAVIKNGLHVLRTSTLSSILQCWDSRNIFSCWFLPGKFSDRTKYQN